MAAPQARVGDLARVQVEGLQPLLRDLRRASAEVQKEVRDELKDTVGETVAGEARSIFARVNTSRSGRTEKAIKPTVRGSTVIIRNTRVRKGFPFPNVLEFAARGASTSGPRASLYPAIDEKENDVLEAFGTVLEHLSDRAGFTK